MEASASNGLSDIADYARNPFRLTGLPVDATGRQIRRRTEELKAAAELGAADPRKPGLLAPEVSAQEALDAIRRLADPVARLRFEFGWLWPVPGGGVGGGSLKDAWSTWTRMLEDGPEARAIGLHNLAIGEHVRAAESPKVLDDIHQWRTSYRDWGRARRDETMWRWLEDRVTAINDPRLQKTYVAAIRDGLSASLVGFHATTVIAAAGDDTAVLGRHRAVILQSGFDADTIGQALADSVEPHVSRLRTLMGRSNEVGSRPQDYRRFGKELSAEVSGRDLRTILALLTGDHPTASGVVDQLALTVRACVVAEVNHPGSQGAARYRYAVEQLDRVCELPIGPHARTTIAEDVMTLLGNLVHRAQEESLTITKDHPAKGYEEYHKLTSATMEPLSRLRTMGMPQVEALAGEVDYARATILAEYLVVTRNNDEVLPLMRNLQGSTGDAEVRSMLADFLHKAEQAGDRGRPILRTKQSTNRSPGPAMTVEHEGVACSVCGSVAFRSRRAVFRRTRAGQLEWEFVMIALCDRHIDKSLSLRGFSALLRLSLLTLAVGVIAWMAGWSGWIDSSLVITASAWTAGSLIVLTIPRRFRRLAIYGSQNMQEFLRDGWRLHT